MKLKPIGSNMTEIETEKATILFSYRTPVAACLKEPVHIPNNYPKVCVPGFIRTNKYWSVTTSKHINKWLEGAKAVEVPQEVLDALV